MGLAASAFFDAYKRAGLLVPAVWTPKATGIPSAATDVYLTSQEIDAGAGVSGVMSMQRTITFPLADFVGMARGDLVTINSQTYFVTEPFQSDDLFMMATLGTRK